MIEPSANNDTMEPRESLLPLVSSAFGDCLDDASFFPSDQHLRALEFMGSSLWTKARLGVVTAESGCGKSVLIRRLLRHIDDRVVVAAVLREHFNPQDFLLEVLRQYGFALDEDDKSNRRRLLERFLKHQAAAGRLCVLIVENPQGMHPSVLEEIRLLGNVDADGVRVLKLLLLGPARLSRVLESPRMADLVSGNAARFALGPLSEDQTAAYVAHRLRAGGALNPDALMPYTLMPSIHAASGGVPALINRLCERALAASIVDGSTHVTGPALERAIDELGLREKLSRESAEVPPLPAEAVGEHEPSAAKLVVSLQGLADREIPMAEARMLIGRGEEADVRIDSVFVSRYHALIVRGGGRDLLLDLGSTNGLLINSRRIVRRILRDGDLIQIGPARVMYVNQASAAAHEPDPGETLAFARPGLPMAAGDEDAVTVMAFARHDKSKKD
jgi:general secretion pathway protein A